MKETEILNAMAMYNLVLRHLPVKEVGLIMYNPQRDNVERYKKEYDNVSIVKKQFNEGEREMLELTKFYEEKWICAVANSRSFVSQWAKWFEGKSAEEAVEKAIKFINSKNKIL